MSPIRLSRELSELGFSSGDLARLTRSEQLVHVRRGAYASPSDTELDVRASHLRLLEATVRQSSPDAVVSHQSAAVVHGLPIWRADLVRAHLTRDRAGGGRTRRYVMVHGHPLAERDTVLLGGFRVTSLARTVLDLACTAGLDRAVAVGDAALRLGLDPAELTEQLSRSVGRQGIGSARRALAMLDARSESPGESRSRVVMVLAGVPTPDLQVELFDDHGQFVARSDFGWRAFRTVGEFDGQVKYGRTLRPGQDVEEVLFSEKLREDAIRDLDVQMARWVSDDLDHPARLVERLQRAFKRGGRSA